MVAKSQVNSTEFLGFDGGFHQIVEVKNMAHPPLTVRPVPPEEQAELDRLYRRIRNAGYALALR